MACLKNAPGLAVCGEGVMGMAPMIYIQVRFASLKWRLIRAQGYFRCKKCLIKTQEMPEKAFAPDMLTARENACCQQCRVSIHRASHTPVYLP